LLKTGGKLFFQKIFDAINFLQIVVYHPLLNLDFPANMLIVNYQLIDIATFDILPTDDFFPTVFNMNTTDMQPLNDNYNDFRFETLNILLNMGSLYLVFLWILAQFLILGITGLRCFKENRCVSKFRDLTTTGLVWTTVIDFSFSAYFEILYAVFLHWKGHSWD